MKEDAAMKFIVILGVLLAFLIAIFTAGYNSEPNKND